MNIFALISKVSFFKQKNLFLEIKICFNRIFVINSLNLPNQESSVYNAYNYKVSHKKQVNHNPISVLSNIT